MKHSINKIFTNILEFNIHNCKRDLHQTIMSEYRYEHVLILCEILW